MLGKGGPRVVSASIDSKRDLEQQLKSCCESFIMNLTKAGVEPMLSFITKVTAVKLAAGTNRALAKPLKEQVSSMHGDKMVAAMLGSDARCMLSRANTAQGTWNNVVE
jgi:hypothetical protein